ncbi:hypothetical protein [Chitinophaga vietnamensis]|uniref:hypothetical protein n=1 Tax=Chitinophaga vietnamensis TaxID=2593957 RepID=UPI001178C36E|nr:hypothetical protein [Chitinophaga vietnamensis]
MMRMKVSRFLLEIPIPAFENAPAADMLLFSTRTGNTVRISRENLDLLHTGQCHLLPEALQQQLSRYEMTVPSGEYENDTIIARKLATAADHAANITTLLLPILSDAASMLPPAIEKICRELPIQQAKESKHTIRLILVLQEHLPCLEWLQQLDAQLPALAAAYDVVFTFQLLYLHPEEALTVPVLEHTIHNHLHFVTGDLWQPKRIANTTGMLQKLLFQLNTTPPEKLQACITLLIAGNCWKNWTPAMTDVLRLLSAQAQATLYCYTDLTAGEELALMQFMAVQNIRCEWLPAASFTYQPNQQASLQHLLRNALQPDSVKVLHTPARLHPEELYHLYQYSSAHLFHPYYTDAFVQHLYATGCSCKSCIHLPLCGGSSTADCPPFTRNIANRVLASEGLLV